MNRGVSQEIHSSSTVKEPAQKERREVPTPSVEFVLCVLKDWLLYEEAQKYSGVHRVPFLSELSHIQNLQP